MNDIDSNPLKPTTKLVVKLGEEGLQLLNPMVAAPILINYFQLETLSEIDAKDYFDRESVASAVAPRTGCETQEVKQFLRMLSNSGRLGRRALIAQVSAAEAQNSSDTGVAAPDENDLIGLKLPLALRLYAGKFQLLNHDGDLILALSPAELIGVSQYTRPTSLGQGISAQAELLGTNAVEGDRMREIVAGIDAAGLISVVKQVQSSEDAVLEQVSFKQIMKENFARQAAEQDECEAAREAETGVTRTKVIPVSFGEAIPAALGLVMAYCKVYNDSDLEKSYDFRLDWVWDDDRLESFTARPAVYLFSNYLWTHEKSIAVSEKVKARSPGSVTIHGGPDTPKYEGDAKAYFDEFPHIDIIVRGEGEDTAADTLDKLRAVMGQDEPDLSVLKDVPGISYRYKGEIYRNPDRERISDLDIIPSPYLMGLFDAYEGVPFLHVTLETNRGCPYGCTFCDWGSATTSKIRKFDLDRVYGDLDWCSRMKVQSVSQADANFGVFERDVDIARHVGELKKKSGYPEAFGGSYAKNSTKYLEEIIKVMADAGILTQGVLSLQTMDAGTLEAINRSNIKTEKYDALASEMRSSNLQLSVELMMGLPGATLDSFVEDLQQCIDRDIQARINHTTMLVNAPMNNPDYREKHQIETGSPLGPGKMPVLVSTSTYTRDDIDAMQAYRQLYILMDNFGVLRYCARFIRQQTGVEEMEFYKIVWAEAAQLDHQKDWPLLNTMANYGQHLMAPPYSWSLFYDEVRKFMVEVCNVADDSALDTIIAAQKAVMPAHGRSFPYSVELPHDVVAWHTQMLDAKAAGHRRDWQTVVPTLSEFEPGRLDVTDVNGTVTKSLGCPMDINSSGVNWDMESDLGRARVNMDFNPAFLVQDDIIQVG